MILDHFETAMRFMIDNPDTMVRNVELINPCEMQRVIPNPSPAEPVNPAQTVLELIETQARLTPWKIAVRIFF